MVTMEPDDRFTAHQCLERGLENGLFRKGSDGEVISPDNPPRIDDSGNATKAGVSTGNQAADRSDCSSSSNSALTVRALPGTQSKKTSGEASLSAGRTGEAQLQKSAG